MQANSCNHFFEASVVKSNYADNICIENSIFCYLCQISNRHRGSKHLIYQFTLWRRSLVGRDNRWERAMQWEKKRKEKRDCKPGYNINKLTKQSVVKQIWVVFSLFFFFRARARTLRVYLFFRERLCLFFCIMVANWVGSPQQICSLVCDISIFYMESVKFSIRP